MGENRVEDEAYYTWCSSRSFYILPRWIQVLTCQFNDLSIRSLKGWERGREGKLQFLELGSILSRFSPQESPSLSYCVAYYITLFTFIYTPSNLLVPIYLENPTAIPIFQLSHLCGDLRSSNSFIQFQSGL